MFALEQLLVDVFPDIAEAFKKKYNIDYLKLNHIKGLSEDGKTIETWNDDELLSFDYWCNWCEQHNATNEPFYWIMILERNQERIVKP